MSKISSVNHGNYRPDIDGLRAIAVLAVVIFHAFPKFIVGGFIGVDIFFVISGYLISSILFSNLENNNFSILTFYKKRILRIYPSLLIVMMVSFIFSWFVLFPSEYMQLGKHMAGGAAFVSNFILWGESGYFDLGSTSKPFLHLWSLAIEEHFYIFWPLLLAFVWARKWNFLLITFVIGFISFSVEIYLSKVDTSASFYFPIARFWELMIGGVLAYISIHRPKLIASYKNQQSIIGFILIMIGFLYINQTRVFPGWLALFPSMGAFLVISGGGNVWLNNKILSNKVMVWFGLISYPLYLWHWPILAFTQIQYGDVSPSTKTLLLISSVTLAWLTYKYIEKPIRFNSRKDRTALALFLIMIIVGLIGFYTYKSGGFVGYSVRTKEKNDFLSYFENSRPDWKYFTKINRAEKYRSDCDFYDFESENKGHMSFQPRKNITENCYKRDTNYPKSIFIWGDSHAQQLNYGLKTELPKSRQLMQVASSGCRPQVIAKKVTEKSYFCDYSNWFAMQAILAAKPDIVVIGQKSDHDLEKMQKISDFLKADGIGKVIFTGPVPEWTPNLPRVMASSLWSSNINRTFDGVNQHGISQDKELKEKFRNDEFQTYISLIDFFCNNYGCITFLGKDREAGIISNDDGYLTPNASIFLAKNLLVPIITKDSNVK